MIRERQEESVVLTDKVYREQPESDPSLPRSDAPIDQVISFADHVRLCTELCANCHRIFGTIFILGHDLGSVVDF